MPAVSRLSIAPVKGLGLTPAERIRLAPDGVPGDRAFVLVDSDDRRISTHRHPVLLTVQSTYDAEADELTLCLRDGVTVTGRVRPGAGVKTRVHRGAVSGYEVEGPFSGALSDVAGATVRVVRVTTPGGGNDVDPVSVLSDATVTRLAHDSGNLAIDPRRFRMLIGLSGCEPHEEDSWIGRAVRIGQAVVRVRGPIERCTVTKLHPDTGDRDLDTLGAIREHRAATGGGPLDLGVYATVDEPGHVRVGDPVTPE